MSNEKIKILVVDDEIDVAEIISFLLVDFIQVDFESKIAMSGNEAISELSLNSYDYCICDHNMPNGTGDKVLRSIVEKNLKTKFILCSTVTPLSHPEEYPSNQVYFNIEKPDVIGGLEKLKDIIMEDAKDIKDIKNTEAYHPIPLRYLDHFKNIPLDIYIKLNPDHYVKFHSEGDEFTKIERDKMIDRSLTTLYVKTNDSNVSVNAIIHEAVTSIFSRNQLSLEEKISHNFNDLVALVTFTGITPELAQTIKHSIIETAKIIEKHHDLHNAWKKINLGSDFPANLYCVQSLICGAILKKHSWNSDQTLFKLTLASFFQDLALSDVPLMELIDYAEFIKHEESFSKPKRSQYLAHPLKARELVEKISSLPPDVEKIVAEQHEAPEGLGFPRKTNASQLQPLSCLFIISGVTARYFLRNKGHFSTRQLVKELEEKGYKSGNFSDSFKVISEFQD